MTSTVPRLHVLGAPLVETSLDFVADDGSDFGALLADCTASLDIDRHGQPLSINFWRNLEQQPDGLFSPMVDGAWDPPRASLRLDRAIPSFRNVLPLSAYTSETLRFSSDNGQLASISLKGTQYVEPEGDFYLASNEVAVGYDYSDSGLEISLSIRFRTSGRVHKDGVTMNAKLDLRCFVPNGALPFLGLFARKAYEIPVEQKDWRPSQMAMGNLATSGNSVAARGTLDWNSRTSRYPGPTGPWVSCHFKRPEMTLKPIAEVSKLSNGLASFSRTEGIMELLIGWSHIEAALRHRDSARLAFEGAGIGFVDGVTTWPMEQGGPRPQSFERLEINLSKTTKGLRMKGSGVIEPTGDLGPDVSFDLLVPALWLKLSGVRLD